MSESEIGIKVVIVEDARPGGQATGQEGIYEGNMCPETGEPRDCGCSPRIALADGSRIWGHQCWWKEAEGLDLEAAHEELRELKTNIHDRIQAHLKKVAVQRIASPIHLAEALDITEEEAQELWDSMTKGPPDGMP